MKLAFIHPFFLRYPRGIERYTANLSSALVAAGVEVDILTWRWKNPLQWRELHSNVRIISVSTPRYYAAQFVWKPYLKHLLQENYDHVFLYFADYGEAPAVNLLHLFKRQPFSIVLHFPYSQVPHRYHSLTRSGLFKKARKIISVSDYVRCEMLNYSGRDSTVISHGVNVNFCPNTEARKNLRAQLNIAPDAPILLSVCALEMRKGVQHMLRALPRILQIIPDVQYLIVGDGPDAGTLRELTRELGLENRARFISATPDVLPYYQSADVFAIPARGEASSLATLEALACQLPVIASHHAPFDELIQSGWGFQLNEENPAAIADTIMQLLLDTQLREKMGKAGRAHILQCHQWDVIAAQYLKLIG